MRMLSNDDQNTNTVGVVGHMSAETHESHYYMCRCHHVQGNARQNLPLHAGNRRSSDTHYQAVPLYQLVKREILNSDA